jgi:hypothetical protein
MLIGVQRSRSIRKVTFADPINMVELYTIHNNIDYPLRLSVGWGEITVLHFWISKICLGVHNRWWCYQSRHRWILHVYDTESFEYFPRIVWATYEKWLKHHLHKGCTAIIIDFTFLRTKALVNIIEYSLKRSKTRKHAFRIAPIFRSPDRCGSVVTARDFAAYSLDRFSLGRARNKCVVLGQRETWLKRCDVGFARVRRNQMRPNEWPLSFSLFNKPTTYVRAYETPRVPVRIYNEFIARPYNYDRVRSDPIALRDDNSAPCLRCARRTKHVRVRCVRERALGARRTFRWHRLG